MRGASKCLKQSVWGSETILCDSVTWMRSTDQHTHNCRIRHEPGVTSAFSYYQSTNLLLQVHQMCWASSRSRSEGKRGGVVGECLVSVQFLSKLRSALKNKVRLKNW